MRITGNSEFIVERDADRCIECRVCENQCSYETHCWDDETEEMYSREEKCVGCQRCVSLCPTAALTVRQRPSSYRDNAYWSAERINDVKRQADTGGILLTGMGNDKEYPIYWDKILLNASQVTNPSIDPLREPMEIRTYLGGKPASYAEAKSGKMPPQVKIDLPVMFSAISYGAISSNVQKSFGKAAAALGTMWNTGEGGLSRHVAEYADNAIV
ncbi:MAG: glutamate synthase-related protein, partial [bacterium]|nr:glutamate synthase-related protein [bacterium]